MIKFICSKCGWKKELPEAYKGKKIKCPGCSESSIVEEALLKSEQDNSGDCAFLRMKKDEVKNTHAATESSFSDAYAADFFWFASFFFGIAIVAQPLIMAAAKSEGAHVTTRDYIPEIALMGFLFCVACTAIIKRLQLIVNELKKQSRIVKDS